MKLKSEGVWIAELGIVRFGAREVAFLEAEAPKTQKLRARLCVHEDADRAHQMLIAFCEGSFNPPHAHERPESILVIKGMMSVLFPANGEFILLRPGEFLRIPPGIVHQPMPVTDCVVMETVEK